jgi:hypothetical protein
MLIGGQGECGVVHELRRQPGLVVTTGHAVLRQSGVDERYGTLGGDVGALARQTREAGDEELVGHIGRRLDVRAVLLIGRRGLQDPAAESPHRGSRDGEAGSAAYVCVVGHTGLLRRRARTRGVPTLVKVIVTDQEE